LRKRDRPPPEAPIRPIPMTKPHYWDEATRVLAERDPVLRKLIAATPGIHLTRRGDPFTTLARAIVGQQISVKAAQAIWERVVAACGRAASTPVVLDPERVRRKRIATLRKLGLSERKAEYIRDLARHFRSARLDPRSWPALDDEALIEALVDVKGIGRWTAEMFLMFHEMRADVLPIDDLGLQKAMALHYFDGERPPLSALREFAEKWRPYRSVATWYLWRSMDPIPVEY
jgi:DNA-3-methyladenine glycosylase II